jgi:DnaK suppressor protein
MYSTTPQSGIFAWRPGRNLPGQRDQLPNTLEYVHDSFRREVPFRGSLHHAELRRIAGNRVNPHVNKCVTPVVIDLVPHWTGEYIGAKTLALGVSRMNEVVDADYVPSEEEPFMNERQKSYFRSKLISWKSDILREARETLEILQQENANLPDLADRASSETDRAIELRARDRQRKLIAKIDAALNRIEEGTYGYCEETGEPIALKRLDARPIATLSIEAQERHERREKVYRDD